MFVFSTLWNVARALRSLLASAGLGVLSCYTFCSWSVAGGLAASDHLGDSRCWTNGRRVDTCCDEESFEDSPCWRDALGVFDYVRCCVLGAAAGRNFEAADAANADNDISECTALVSSRFSPETPGATAISACCGLPDITICWPDKASFVKCCLPALPRMVGESTPSWIREHVDADLRVPAATLAQSVDDQYSDAEDLEDLETLRYVFHKGELDLLGGRRPLGSYDQMHNAVSGAVRTLLSVTPFNAFLHPSTSVTLHVFDGYFYTGPGVDAPSRRHGPLLVNARLKTAAPGTVLLPQWYFLLFWNRKIVDEVLMSRLSLPDFPYLRDKLIWRGSTTLTRHYSAHSDWWRTPRFALVNMSVHFPEFIDARFTAIKPYVDPRTVAEIHNASLVVDEMAVSEQLEYRYLIHIEGAQESKSLYWQLLAPGVVFLPASPIESWASRMLRPWVHYIPVREDLANLVQRLRWARENVEKCAAISSAATRLALSRLNPQAAMAYLAYALQGAARLAAPDAAEDEAEGCGRDLMSRLPALAQASGDHLATSGGAPLAACLKLSGTVFWKLQLRIERYLQRAATAAALAQSRDRHDAGASDAAATTTALTRFYASELTVMERADMAEGVGLCVPSTCARSQDALLRVVLCIFASYARRSCEEATHLVPPLHGDEINLTRLSATD